MKINMLQVNAIYFTRKAKSIFFNYYLHDILTSRSDFIKDFGVALYSKLHFHSHDDYIPIYSCIEFARTYSIHHIHIISLII
jgi:hypothetical protein